MIASLKELLSGPYMPAILCMTVFIIVLLIIACVMLVCRMTKRTNMQAPNNGQSESFLENETLQAIAGENVNDTKLDLARAYIDMEEAGNAKVLLNEVLAEGDVTQKDEAKSLLNEL